MPITKGAGNPKWTRDETILALDLLYRHGAPLDRSHPDVVELSNLLRQATIYPVASRKENFRNGDGVALKMQNLLSAIDPTRGLSSSKGDRFLVAEYPVGRKGELATIAAAIRNEISSFQNLVDGEDEETFIEGRIVTSAHRQRDRRLRRKLLAKHQDAALQCEVCGFRPPPLDRSLQESFFEAHHVVALGGLAGPTSTGVRDMALVCAGCHRYVHRLIASLKRWVGIAEAREAYFTTVDDA